MKKVNKIISKTRERSVIGTVRRGRLTKEQEKNIAELILEECTSGTIEEEDGSGIHWILQIEKL